nr:hypothetical protein [Paenibacillus lemnae]
MTVGFILLGFIVLISMKKGMERKLAFITASTEGEESSTRAKSIIRWIAGATAWGVASMFLVVWCFHHYLG